MGPRAPHRCHVCKPGIIDQRTAGLEFSTRPVAGAEKIGQLDMC